MLSRRHLERYDLIFKIVKRNWAASEGNRESCIHPSDPFTQVESDVPLIVDETVAARVAIDRSIPESVQQAAVKDLEGKEKRSFLQKKKNEVFTKSLDGKLMLVSFDEEDSVYDLPTRVAKQVGVHESSFCSCSKAEH